MSALPCIPTVEGIAWPVHDQARSDGSQLFLYIPPEVMQQVKVRRVDRWGKRVPVRGVAA